MPPPSWKSTHRSALRRSCTACTWYVVVVGVVRDSSHCSRLTLVGQTRLAHLAIALWWWVWNHVADKLALKTMSWKSRGIVIIAHTLQRRIGCETWNCPLGRRGWRSMQSDMFRRCSQLLRKRNAVHLLPEQESGTRPPILADWPIRCASGFMDPAHGAAAIRGIKTLCICCVVHACFSASQPIAKRKGLQR